MRTEPTRYRAVVLTSWDRTLLIGTRFKLHQYRSLPN
jgi:hypothetical protein